MFKSNTMRFSTFTCHRQSSAIGIELAAGQKAATKKMFSKRCGASPLEIGGSVEKMSTAVTAQAITLAPNPLNNSLNALRNAIGI